jgi:hypothetical protein
MRQAFAQILVAHRRQILSPAPVAIIRATPAIHVAYRIPASP